MIATQHSGDGKANQYFLRGFNLDHGTDFRTTVAGVPVELTDARAWSGLHRSQLPDSPNWSIAYATARVRITPTKVISRRPARPILTMRAGSLARWLR